MVMNFRTKRELLRHLGKNEDDRKLVDRMMLKWLVYKENWMYILVEWEVDRVSLIRENEALRKKIKSLSERVSELEYELENVDSGGDRKMAEKIYNFLVYQCHMDIDKTEFMEAIGF